MPAEMPTLCRELNVPCKEQGMGEMFTPPTLLVFSVGDRTSNLELDGRGQKWKNNVCTVSNCKLDGAHQDQIALTQTKWILI